jgi:uncharacterized membrane protein (GlpM family)
MKEMVLRFLVGGVVVSVFAMLGDVLKPKSFAGLFAAAPSVALATLSLAIVEHGKDYARVESRSMMIGGFAFLIYAWLVSCLLMRRKLPTFAVTGASISVWLVAAFGLWLVTMR